MSMQYLSFGVVDGRTHSDRDLALLRAAELQRADARRARRADALRRLRR